MRRTPSSRGCPFDKYQCQRRQLDVAARRYEGLVLSNGFESSQRR